MGFFIVKNMTRLNKGYLLYGHRSFLEKKPRILGTSEIHLGLVVTRDLKKGVGSRPTLVRRKL